MWYVAIPIHWICFELFEGLALLDRVKRLTMFVFALQTVMVLKYLVKDYPIQTLYFGIANVVANGLVMLRCVSSENGSLIFSV